MSKSLQCQAKLLKPLQLSIDSEWAFIILPNNISQGLPRRGRTSVLGKINDCDFTATLEPDGQLSHWLKVDKKLQDEANLKVGDVVSLEITPVKQEPEPEIPKDFYQALQDSPQALPIWQATTTLARVDWIHWVTSAKQAKTRIKRINDACNMLSEGKHRVCCFDPSGFYSKALSAPEAAE